VTHLPADLDRILYAELVHLRPPPPSPFVSQFGPTAQFAELEIKRALWKLAASELPFGPVEAAS